MKPDRLQDRMRELLDIRRKIAKRCERCGETIPGNRYGSQVLNAIAHSLVCFGHVPEPSRGEPVYLDDPHHE